jgi:hypothetical protein
MHRSREHQCEEEPGSRRGQGQQAKQARDSHQQAGLAAGTVADDDQLPAELGSHGCCGLKAVPMSAGAVSMVAAARRAAKLGAEFQGFERGPTAQQRAAEWLREMREAAGDASKSNRVAEWLMQQVQQRWKW